MGRTTNAWRRLPSEVRVVVPSAPMTILPEVRRMTLRFTIFSTTRRPDLLIIEVNCNEGEQFCQISSLKLELTCTDHWRDVVRVRRRREGDVGKVVRKRTGMCKVHESTSLSSLAKTPPQHLIPSKTVDVSIQS